MTGFNHALTGGLIAKLLPLPVAVPVAFASHFCLDAMPHYGLPHEQRDKSKLWRTVFITDFFAAIALVIIPLSRHHPDMIIGGAVAVSPDLVWVRRVIRDKSFNLSANRHWFTKWHARIQGFERPWGLWVELPVAAALLYFVTS